MLPSVKSVSLFEWLLGKRHSNDWKHCFNTCRKGCGCTEASAVTVTKMFTLANTALLNFKVVLFEFYCKGNLASILESFGLNIKRRKLLWSLNEMHELSFFFRVWRTYRESLCAIYYSNLWLEWYSYFFHPWPLLLYKKKK